MKRKTPKTESNLKKMNLTVLKKKNTVTILKGKIGRKDKWTHEQKLI